MASRTQGSLANRTSGPKIGLFFSTALASMALASCTASAPPAQVSYTKAQTALEKGKIGQAIEHGEAAVLASPRDPGYRALLGSAYLEAGRYNSAATTFGDAIELGDTRARTILSYALTKVAVRDNRAATAMLMEHKDNIPHADLGLALALAGDTERGIEYLVGAIRNGSASPKARQNLAYAYALAGNWRAARVMASEDVPPAQLDARMSEWAATARPEDAMLRVSKLLGLSPVNDGGQPQHLALSNFPSQPQMVAEAETMVEPAEKPVQVAAVTPAAPRQSEAMAFGIENIDTASTEPKRAIEQVDPTPVAAPSPVPSVAVATPARATPARTAPARTGPRFVSNEVVQKMPERAAPAPARTPTRVAEAPRQQREAASPAPVATGAAATHLIQLGSFDSLAVAEQKWSDLKRRFPDLRERDVVITEAEVDGRTFFRVAAGGFDSRSARSTCNTVKASGRGCFAYAKTNPPAGAVDRGVRVASRTR